MHYWHRVVWVVCTLVAHGSFAWLLGLQPAGVYVTRGDTLLLQARHTEDESQRERLIAAAVAAFKDAYQFAGQTTQVQALVGAAQGYLLMQSPRRRLPFLWQATPLQRAEKSLQQALFLQPDNSAAALLLALVYQRQALGAQTQQTAQRQRSSTYWARAAALGLPVRLSTSPAAQDDLPIPLFDVQDTLVALRYVDARGHGQTADLVFIYRPVAAPTALFGVVVLAGKAYPLITDRATGALADAVVLHDLEVVPQQDSRPMLRVTVNQGAAHIEARFTWDGKGFVHVER